jgi:dihydrodipicolinate synthase/N-acetylneuraminate lyase
VIPVDELRQRWQGVVIPLVTPFKEDLTLDLSALERNVRWLLEKGAQTGNSVLLAAGSGGDFTSMSLDERKQVIRTVAEMARGRVPVIAGAQSTDIRDAIALCQFGEVVGLDAVQLSGPFYYDGRPGDVLNWMQQVARHTGLGFAVYNNWYTGYNMPLDLVDQLLEIPNSIAVKWSSPNPFIFMEGIRRFNRRAVVVDNAFLLNLSYPLGVRCHVSHLPNFYPEHSWRVHELYTAGRFLDASQEWDRCMVPWLKLVAPIQAQTAGEGVFVRPAMRLVSLEGGRSRPPSRDEVITADVLERYREHLTAFQKGDASTVSQLHELKSLAMAE